MPIRIRRALLLAALLVPAAPAAAHAAEFPAGECPRYGDLRICTAQVSELRRDAAGRGPDAAGRQGARAAAGTR